MLTLLRKLLDLQQIQPLSFFFARFIAEHCDPEMADLAACSAALVCERNQEGDVCIDLKRYAGQAFFPVHEASNPPQPVAPSLVAWRTSLHKLTCVGQAGSMNPLILEGNRLYLGKYWHAEQQIYTAITARLEQPLVIASGVLQQWLQSLFPESDSGKINDQQQAAAIAIRHRFAVISGGPGTGKTTTVYRLLRLLLKQQPALKVVLAAPTGKAAARLLNAIQEHQKTVSASPTEPGIPLQTHTLHRLLGFNGRSFRYHRGNQLALDCLIVDEASMIDLALMAQLFDALPTNARLILLGDRDQLAAVEAGNVLGDITGHGQELHYSQSQQHYLHALFPQWTTTTNTQSPAVTDCIAQLQTSYRFSADTGIGRLAILVNRGQGSAALELLQHDTSTQLQWLPTTGQCLQPQAMDWIINGYSQYLYCRTITDALDAFEQLRVLTALHHGPYGERELNHNIHQQLTVAGLLGKQRYCRGVPVMILKNDYEVGLFNGDTGILWEDEEERLCAWFRAVDQSPRAIPLARLPNHCPAWALTVHKAQGSEFSEILLVLPDADSSSVLSRELVYTGITRARQRVLIHGSEQAFRLGCRNRIQRSSGLADKLGWTLQQQGSR